MQIEHPARSGFNIYARFLSGKKIRIIPIFKDEGIGGDRDYLQWDTISLMSLFGVHVIISYYIFAQRHPRRADKITAQRLDVKQNKKVGMAAEQAFKLYERISSITSEKCKSIKNLSPKNRRIMALLKNESVANNFRLMFNNILL